MQYKDRVKAIKKIVGSHYFTVIFIKKDGSEREMLCQFKTMTWKGNATVKGIGAKYAALERGLMTIWSVNDEQWRNVNLDTLTELRYKKRVYRAWGVNNATVTGLFPLLKAKKVAKALTL